MADIERLHRRYLLDPRPMNLVRWLEALLQADRFEDVVRAAEAETARFPDYAPLRIVLARAYMGLGRWDLARPHLEEVLRRDATHLRAWEALLEIHAAQDRWDDVATCLENLEMLGWEPEKLRLWKERLAEYRPPPPAIHAAATQEITLPAPSPSPPKPGGEAPSRPPEEVARPAPEPPPQAPGRPDTAGAAPSPPLQGAWPPGWVPASLGLPTWADAWAVAQPAESFFRRQRPRPRGVSPEDPAWYNLTVYWNHLSTKGGEDG
ncbi:hypothetical protein HRbin11_01345 [bacterium HR11]|nr:hypothetical protein HRbin11_01345 [bacterium HR11]